MAAIGVDPVPNTPSAAKRVFEEHLAKVLRGRALADLGWSRLDDLTLLVPLRAERESGQVDDFLLRLGFGYYPDWPPSAQFVNPTTHQYVYPDDVSHLPRISGTNEIAVHARYDRVGQLICASVTLEFYQIRHGVNPEHLWDPTKQNFAATINAIAHWLRPPYYKGRQTR